MAEHSELTDPYLHEPIGQSTAEAGTVYVADGNGSGSHIKLPVTSLDIETPAVADITNAISGVTATGTVTDITYVKDIDGSGLTKTPSAVMSDVPLDDSISITVRDSINQNFAELFSLYENLEAIHTQIRKDIYEVATKLNETVEALKTIGVVVDE